MLNTDQIKWSRGGGHGAPSARAVWALPSALRGVGARGPRGVRHCPWSSSAVSSLGLLLRGWAPRRPASPPPRPADRPAAKYNDKCQPAERRPPAAPAGHRPAAGSPAPQRAPLAGRWGAPEPLLPWGQLGSPIQAAGPGARWRGLPARSPSPRTKARGGAGSRPLGLQVPPWLLLSSATPRSPSDHPCPALRV